MKTLSDLTTALRRYVGNDTSDRAQGAVLSAAQSALRQLPTLSEWDYYRTHGNVNTRASFNAGTVQYTEATRQLVLTGDTWPAWAAGAQVRLGDFTCDVATRDSGTQLTLAAGSTPGADLAAGSTYTLFQCLYDLPAGLTALDQVQISGFTASLFLQPSRSFTMNRVFAEGPGQPLEYSFQGTLTGAAPQIALWPPPDKAYRLDFSYRRRPSAAGIESEARGDVTGTAAGSTLTGNGTAFTGAHAGAVVRVSYDDQQPTGFDGLHPPAEEFRVLSVASATSLTIDGVLATSPARAAYEISAFIDVEEFMWELVLRLAERFLRPLLRIKPNADDELMYQECLRLALGADGQRSSARVVAGGVRQPYPLPGYPSRTVQSD